jgi:hypothetical protein
MGLNKRHYPTKKIKNYPINKQSINHLRARCRHKRCHNQLQNEDSRHQTRYDPNRFGLYFLSIERWQKSNKEQYSEQQHQYCRENSHLVFSHEPSLVGRILRSLASFGIGYVVGQRQWQ